MLETEDVVDSNSSPIIIAVIILSSILFSCLMEQMDGVQASEQQKAKNSPWQSGFATICQQGAITLIYFFMAEN